MFTKYLDSYKLNRNPQVWKRKKQKISSLFLQSQKNEVSQENFFEDWNRGPKWMVAHNANWHILNEKKLLQLQRVHFYDTNIEKSVFFTLH